MSIARRWIVAYFVLYMLPFPASAIPGVDGLLHEAAGPWRALVGWVGQALLGVDWLIYQDLADLEEAVAGPKGKVGTFDSSCFNGEYVTGTDPDYFDSIRQLRSDAAKSARRAS